MTQAQTTNGTKKGPWLFFAWLFFEESESPELGSAWVTSMPQ